MTTRACRHIRRQWRAYTRWLIAETFWRQLCTRQPTAVVVGEVVT